MAQELVPSVPPSTTTSSVRSTSSGGGATVEVGAESGPPVSPTLAGGAAHSITPPVDPPSSPRDTELPVREISDREALANVGADAAGRLQHQFILSKGKTLRAEPSKFGRSLGTVEALRRVVPSGETSGGGKCERTWVKVQARTSSGVHEGWINTKDSMEDKPIALSGEPEAIMAKSGPRPEDVKQGSFGDCYLLAPLMSLAQRKPQFIQSSLFRTDPTEPAASYTLEFHNDESKDGRGPFRPERVSVRSTILRHQSKLRASDGSINEAGEAYGAKGPALWPAIVEKAFLAWPGRNHADKAEGGQAHRAAGMLTGEVHDNNRVHASPLELKADPDAGTKALARQKSAIIKALATEGSGALTASTVSKAPAAWANEEVGAGGSSGEGMVGGIAFGHVYSIVSANESSITLRNPWGSYARVNGVVVPDAAESVLPWDEFDLVFSSWSIRAAVQPRPKPSPLPMRRR